MTARNRLAEKILLALVRENSRWPSEVIESMAGIALRTADEFLHQAEAHEAHEAKSEIMHRQFMDKLLLSYLAGRTQIRDGEILAEIDRHSETKGPQFSAQMPPAGIEPEWAKPHGERATLAIELAETYIAYIDRGPDYGSTQKQIRLERAVAAWRAFEQKRIPVPDLP